MKKKLLSLAQLLVGAAILGLIFWKLRSTGNLDKLVEAVQTGAGNWPLLVAAGIGAGISLVFCTIRWHYLLEAQGVKLGLGRLFTLYLIGQFFSAFMLGATGGDVVKAYYVSTEARHKRAEVVATVFFDRLVGLLALVGLIVVTMFCRLDFFMAHTETRVAMVFNIGLLTLAIAGLLVVFRRNIFEKWAIFRRIDQKTGVGDVITRVYSSMRLCLSHPGVLPKTLFMSFLNHMAMVVWSLCIAKAIGLPVNFIDMLTVVPLINAVGAIPVTPGGLGTRDAAAIFMLGAMGIPAAGAVTFSLLCYGGILLWSLIGGLFYIFYAWQRGRPEEVVGSDQ